MNNRDYAADDFKKYPIDFLNTICYLFYLRKPQIKLKYHEFGKNLSAYACFCELEFFDQNFTSNIPLALGCASDTKIDLKITPTNIKDLNKFKETIKDYDAKYYNLKINGQNESGYLYNYKRSCIKEIISINTDETDDIIFESLIANLEKWMQNNND